MRRQIFSLVLLAGCGMEEADDQLATIESELTTASHGDDIVVLGSSHPQILVAFAQDYADALDAGKFEIVAVPGSELFAGWARVPGVKRLAGDFNRDGRTDLALVGGQDWDTIPVALANGHGGFTISNSHVGSAFNIWARTAGTNAFVGDFNRDGMADIALTGAPGWASIPVAFSYGDGSFDVRNGSSPLATLAVGVPVDRIHVGDYNKDGLSDIAIIGVGTTLPVAFAAYGGNWTFTATQVGSFNASARVANMKSVVGDFNKDGFSDIALVGAGGSTIPVASSSGGGQFLITDRAIGGWWWPHASSRPGAKPFVGDANGDGYHDIMMLGGTNLGQLAIAMSRSGGEFQSGGSSGYLLAQVSGYSDRMPLAGDFDADGFTEFVVLSLGRTDFDVIYSSRNRWGSFTDYTRDVPGFMSFAGEAAAQRFVGRFN
jgi:hypothetical protein